MRITGPGSVGGFQPVAPVRRRRRPSLRTSGDVPLPEVLFEMTTVGSYVRCAAIDPRTNIEVVIVGSARHTEAEIRQAAVAKLEYVIRKRRDGRWQGL